MSRERFRWLLKNAWQFTRFALVGACNTLVDFAVTNLLVLSFHPRTGLGYLFVSLTACAVATLNSYFMNQRWTFRTASGEPARGALSKFYLVAGVSLLINTSVFLFFVRFLPSRFALDELAVVNLAKLAGVVVAFTVSFLGYRFGVFHTESVREFRRKHAFDLEGGPSFLRQGVVLVLGALAARLGYLLLAGAVYGRGAECAAAARTLAAGGLLDPGSFPGGPFCLWQALFVKLGLGPSAAPVLASLVPGVLLMLPVAWMARRLFGPRAAWLAGAFTAVHPRLVEYSCNGFPEGFSLLFFTLAVASITALPGRGGAGSGMRAGASFGVAAAVSSELTLAFGAALVMVPYYARKGLPREGAGKGVPWRRVVSSLVGGGVAFVALTSMARAWTGAWLPLPAVASLAGYPARFMDMLMTLPGVVLTPTAVLAMMLPIFLGRATVMRNARLPLLLMLLFPVLYYPLSPRDPALLLPALVPLQIFGAAGLMALAAYTSREVKISGLRQWLAAGILVFSAAVCAWRGLEVARSFPETPPPARAKPSARLRGTPSGEVAGLAGLPAVAGVSAPVPWKAHVPGPGGHTILGDVRVVAGFPGPGGERPVDLWVLLPDGYDGSKTRYPVLYVFGGPAAFDAAASAEGEWNLDETLALLRAAKKKRTAIVVCWAPSAGPAVWGGAPAAREETGDLPRFVAESLKPSVDTAFRTRPERESTGVLGAGDGSWPAFETWLRYPDRFGRVAVFSLRGVPGPETLEAYTDGASRGRKGARLYVHLTPSAAALPTGPGESPADAAARLQRAHDAERLVVFLETLGYGKGELLTAAGEGEPDGPSAWSRRAPEALLWLLK
ncbi:MAG: GtrA family protein [Acidobacteria bacterium]|nr:GtrA family protein [Acidobacteriota bacterium]